MKQSVRVPIFKERLNKLMGGLSVTDFANKIGLSRQTVGFYLNGDRIPDCETLIQICTKCDVSSDWLLGLSEDHSRKACAVDELGLSSDVVGLLRHCNNSDTLKNAIKGLNLLLNDVDGLFFLREIKSIYELSELIGAGAHATSLSDKKTTDLLQTDRVSELTDSIVAEELQKELIEKYPELLGKIRVSCGLESVDYEIKRISSSIEQHVRMVTKYYESYYKGRFTYQESGGSDGNN